MSFIICCWLIVHFKLLRNLIIHAQNFLASRKANAMHAKTNDKRFSLFNM